MSTFKDRLPHLIEEYRRTEEAINSRIAMMTDDMWAEFQWRHGLTEVEMEQVEKEEMER